MLVEGAGLPLAVAGAGAHRNDLKVLAVTLDGVVIARPEPTPEAPHHLCLDAGYDCAACRAAAEPGLIRYTRNLKGATKTTWYQVESLPE